MGQDKKDKKKKKKKLQQVSVSRCLALVSQWFLSNALEYSRIGVQVLVGLG